MLDGELGGAEELAGDRPSFVVGIRHSLAVRRRNLRPFGRIAGGHVRRVVAIIVHLGDDALVDVALREVAVDFLDAGLQRQAAQPLVGVG